MSKPVRRRRPSGLRHVAGMVIPLLTSSFAFAGLSWGSVAIGAEVLPIVSPRDVTTWLVRDSSSPTVTLHFEFSRGAAFSPAGKEGLAALTAAMLDEGAGPYGGEEFSIALTRNFASLQFYATKDSIAGVLQVRRDRLDTALDLLKLALTEPHIDQDTLDRVKSQIATTIDAQLENTDHLAREAWWRTGFPDHPYGRPVFGTAQSLSGLTRADVLRQLDTQLRRDNLHIAVVGDIGANRIGEFLDRAFGELPAKPASPHPGFLVPVTASEVVLVDAQTPQSVVVFGHTGVPRDHPDYYAAAVLAHILGGTYAGSRLVDEIRIKRGLAYIVQASISNFSQSSLIDGLIATEAGQVETVIELVRDEWARLAKYGPTEDELERAKRYLTGVLPIRLDGSVRLAAALARLQRLGIGPDFMSVWQSEIDALTIESVRDAAARLLDPNALTFVVAGPRSGVLADQSRPPDFGD